MAAVIRPARRADAAAIDGILRRARRDAYRGAVDESDLGLGVDGLAEFERALARHAEGTGCSVIAEVDGLTRGFAGAGATADPDDDPCRVGHVQVIYVDPDLWRSGIGRALMTHLDGWLEKAGFGEATLWVRDRNARGRAFYEALGWRQDGAAKATTIADRVRVTELRYRRRIVKTPDRGLTPVEG